MVGSFGMSLFSTLAQAEGSSGNLLVSPISVAMAMGMVLLGATPDSTCQKQLLSLLGVSSHTDITELASRVLLANENESSQVNLATSVWSKGLISSFVSAIEKTYPSATAAPLPSTFKPINEWVSRETQGAMTNLFEDEGAPMDPLTRGLLVSAVHFKGMWENQFETSKTVEGDFHVYTETKEKANFMKAQRKMYVAEVLPHHGGATAIRLDCVGKQYSAMFLLPKENNAESMSEAIDGLTAESLEVTLQKSFQFRDTSLRLVRFQLEWGPTSLVESLRRMGVTDVFDGHNVLNQMSTDETVHLDNVLHQASMEVTEEGTVATAATAAVVKARSLIMPLEVTFDRPFLVVVLHTLTATPLFVGKVKRPVSPSSCSQNTTE